MKWRRSNLALADDFAEEFEVDVATSPQSTAYAILTEASEAMPDAGWMLGTVIGPGSFPVRKVDLSAYLYSSIVTAYVPAAMRPDPLAAYSGEQIDAMLADSADFDRELFEALFPATIRTP
ncbi:MAG: hypothetical protein WEB59_08000 [Thermoanaerobaculia bacterium]